MREISVFELERLEEGSTVIAYKKDGVRHHFLDKYQ